MAVTQVIARIPYKSGDRSGSRHIPDDHAPVPRAGEGVPWGLSYRLCFQRLCIRRLRPFPWRRSGTCGVLDSGEMEPLEVAAEVFGSDTTIVAQESLEALMVLSGMWLELP